MSIDPNATPKDYSVILYSKTEINILNHIERTRVDDALDLKVSKQSLGSPIGTATLDADGKHSLVEIPIATVIQSEDPLENTKVMTPERVHHVLEAGAYITQVSGDIRYGDLKSDGTVKMSSAYIPQAQKDLATVEFVQTLVATGTTTYIKNTLAEMLALPVIVVGDICYVIADSANDGEYVCISPVLGGSVVGDWHKRTSTVAYGNLIGNIADQTDLDDRFNAVESDVVNIEAKTDFITVTQPIDLDALDTSVVDNASDIGTILNSIDSVVDSITITNSLGVDLDTLLNKGLFEVDTNLPNGTVLGVLEVEVFTDSNISTVIQTLQDTSSLLVYIRVYNGTTWTIWKKSHISDQVEKNTIKLLQTATKDAVAKNIINTYSGTTAPDVSLGKNYDRYHKFSTTVTDNIVSTTSYSGYEPSFFSIFVEGIQGGVQNNVNDMYIASSNRELHVDYSDGYTPKFESASMTVGGTLVPLTIQAITSGSAIFTYLSSSDATIQGITASTSITYDNESTTGTYEDYEKLEDKWFITKAFDQTYDFQKVSGQAINNDTFTTIGQLTTPTRSSGVYEYSFSMSFKYSTTSRSAFFRFSIDGGNHWYEFAREPKDTTDTYDMYYAFPYVESVDKVIDLVVQAKCENNSDTLTILFLDIVAERKH